MSHASVERSKSNGQQGVYRTIWRWHFYAGLFCIPLVITLALSGAIYLFKPQIDAWVDRPYQNLPATDKRSTANQQIDAALKAVPDTEFFSYQLPDQENQAVTVHLQQSGERTLVYLNPYTLEVLKIVAHEDQFIRLVRTFHGELLAGNAGSVVVELAACWAIVLVISGLYLWWPRAAKGVAGVLYPRLRQGSRIFWRDLHAVTGIWISAMVLFLLISGLPWALVWGSAFKEIRQWNAVPVQQDWSSGRAEEKSNAASNRITPIDLSETLLSSAMVLNFASPVLLSASRDNPDVWTLKSRHPNRPLRSDAWLHGKSGEVMRIKPFHERPIIDRVIGIGIAAHEGQLFGWFNQLLGVITALGLVVVSISGAVLWWRRKPERMLGVPPLMPDVRIGKTVTMITLLLAAVLPLLAISILIVLLVEWLVLRRFEWSRRWLGLHHD